MVKAVVTPWARRSLCLPRVSQQSECRKLSGRKVVKGKDFKAAPKCWFMMVCTPFAFDDSRKLTEIVYLTQLHCTAARCVHRYM